MKGDNLLLPPYKKFEKSQYFCPPVLVPLPPPASQTMACVPNFKPHEEEVTGHASQFYSSYSIS